MDRLRQRADFLAVANGARAGSVAFAVQSRRRDDDGPIRVGFTVTKKNGTAAESSRDSMYALNAWRSCSRLICQKPSRVNRVAAARAKSEKRTMRLDIGG